MLLCRIPHETKKEKSMLRLAYLLLVAAAAVAQVEDSCCWHYYSDCYQRYCHCSSFARVAKGLPNLAVLVVRLQQQEEPAVVEGRRVVVRVAGALMEPPRSLTIE